MLTFEELCVPREAFLERFCDGPPGEDTLAVLAKVEKTFTPDGFFMLERAFLDNSPKAGQLTILPYGGASTYKTPPIDRPVSPTGNLGDLATVVAILKLKD